MNQNGATLLELLMTLAVTAILISLAVPGFAFISQTNRLAGATNDLVAALHLTRSEAIKRNGRAVLCASDNGTACSSVAWDRGWIVFHDANNNAALDADEHVISRHTAISGVRLTGNFFVSRYVSYVPTGSAKTVSGFGQAGTFTICAIGSDAPYQAREVILATTGRVRTTKQTLSSCP